jgi:NodT family efflux transporter outer membrane factor (OMF) lipoprotein
MTASTRSLILAATLSVLAVAGCNLAPHYDAPKAETPPAFKEAVVDKNAAEGWKVAEPRDSEIKGNWWEVYRDPQLNELESRVEISNQTVAAAEANYRAARALVSEARAALFPTLSVAPSVIRSRSSASGGSSNTTIVSSGPGTNGSGTGGSTSGTTGSTTGNTGTTTTGQGQTTTTNGGNNNGTRTLYTLPLEASYEVDLWGSVRNAVAQDRYAAQASAAQVATALLSTQSQLAQDYFQLRAVDEQRRILGTTLADYQASIHLVRTLFTNGLASDEDLAEADNQLDSAQAQATDLGIARAQFEHAIAVLIGVPPARFSLAVRPFNPALPVIPVGLPSDLIERRPDIATAERQVASTNAAIGIARAAYFPQLTLSASAGFESTTLPQLLDWPNRFWSFGPELAQILFDGGARRAATEQARALNDQAAANYREAVLTALQSVEDNLASLRVLSQELSQQHGATVAAQHTVELSVDRFKNGIDSYVNVITAQNSFLTSREAELSVQLRQLVASVNLVNNLGGGWDRAHWGRTERLAEHPGSETNKGAPGETAAAIPNPPPLPSSDIRPEEILKQNAEDMTPPPPADSH